MLRPTGDLIESIAELHLSDPSLDEARGAFGSLSKPFNGWRLELSGLPDPAAYFSENRRVRSSA